MAGLVPAIVVSGIHDHTERMTAQPVIGLVVPFADDIVPEEGRAMYPHARFLAKGVGARSLTPEGHDDAFGRIVPAAAELAARGAQAIMVIGTSLTFHRGHTAHEGLLAELRERTGLPASTMSHAVVEGLRSVGGRRIAVATAYADEVNARLAAFLGASGFELLSLKGFGLTDFSGPAAKSERDIVDLGSAAVEAAGAPDALLIACGGLLTLGVADPLERAHGVPVVTSTQSSFWLAMRLAGADSHVPGRGRMLAQASSAAA